MTANDLTPKFADGSDLPDYTTGGSLHRDVDGAARVGMFDTNDAEFIADLWGVVMDLELNTPALGHRLNSFVRSNYGAVFAEKLMSRSKARTQEIEPHQIETVPILVTEQNRRYRYGHTQPIQDQTPQSAYDLYE